MDEKKVTRMFAVLIVLVVVLALALAYVLLVQPSINGYVVDKQVEAQEILVSNIVSQVEQNGYVQIPVGEEDALILVPYNPPAGEQGQQEIQQGDLAGNLEQGQVNGSQ